MSPTQNRLILLLAVLLQFDTADCCPPGTGSDGQILTSPTFTFQFNPPTSWTYWQFDTPNNINLSSLSPPATYGPGQQSSLAMAQRAVNSSIDSAILIGLNSLGISSLSSYTYTISGYTPDDVLTRPSGPTAAIAPAGSYVIEVNAVTTIRTMDGSDIGTPYIKTMSITVRNTQFLVTRGQWTAIANAVMRQLIIVSQVHFISAININ